ncbi:MAG: lysostaphin resistance A-like protein [Methanobacteriaceae archaeon]
MENKFLNNGKEGKNNWWRHLLTIVLTWSGVQTVVLGIISVLLLVVLNTSIDITNIISGNNIYLLLVSFLLIAGINILAFFLSTKFLNKRKAMSFINTIESYDIKGTPIKWFKRFRWDRFLKGVVIWGVFSVIVQLISYILNPNDFVFNSSINVPLLIFLLITCLFVQVSFEELFFRGYLNQLISIKIKKPLLVIILSSIFFALPHAFNATEPLFIGIYILLTFMLGLILSVATLYDNGIEMAIGIHLINNIIAFCFPGGDQSGAAMDSLFKISSANILLTQIIAVVTMIIFIVVVFFYKKDGILKALEIK